MIANVFRHVPIDRGPATEIKPKEAWTSPWRLHPGRNINRKLDKTLHTLILFTILIITIPITINIIPTILIITTTTISSAMIRFLVCWVRSQLLEGSTSSRACAAASRRLETPGSLRWGLFSQVSSPMMMTMLLLNSMILINHEEDFWEGWWSN